MQDGKPVLGDGRVLDVANVVWCTGFGKDTDWIQVPIGEDRWPTQTRGVVADAPGLYFVGLPFLQGFYSMLIGGVGRDAGFVARHIARRMSGASAATALAPIAAGSGEGGSMRPGLRRARRVPSAGGRLVRLVLEEQVPVARRHEDDGADEVARRRRAAS